MARTSRAAIRWIQVSTEISDYIADFCCPERGLVIELDGGQHVEQSAYDAKRTDRIRIAGFKVIRFWNSEVIENLE